MNYIKRLFQLSVLFFSILFYSQSDKHDVIRGNFTYILKAKLNTQTPDYVHEEFFSLYIGENRAFFASTQSLKKDTVMANSIVSTKNPDGSIVMGFKNGTSLPKTKFSYTIIQSNDKVQYFQQVGMSVLTYKEPVIGNWKLIDETKIINTFNCKKATITYKGRNWTAWYAAEIPLPYGPYKFSGLPGLIIKITDDKNEYDFELVKSVPTSELEGKLINIKKTRYTGAIETTQPKFQQALKANNENIAAVLASSGTTILGGPGKDQSKAERIRPEQKVFKPYRTGIAYIRLNNRLSYATAHLILILFSQRNPQFIQSTHQSYTCSQFYKFSFCKMLEYPFLDFLLIIIVVSNSFCPAQNELLFYIKGIGMFPSR
ncbi:GLPGLI family protein [Chryseobacterium capnotolerans]|uniref:GLPGLI family protein n=1 Tax=Chryseobacterium capnotolerans TaxID=2759528 RepID=UPI001E30A97E|nr:GLPGLI family protein [Chryseobacterium capnotolerans]